jgi:hypothetical protein
MGVIRCNSIAFVRFILGNSIWCRPMLSKLDRAIKLLICIREVAGSNIGQDTDNAGAHKKC